MSSSEVRAGRPRLGAAAAAAMAAAVLVACGPKKDAAPADAPGSEVVATVNGDELTASQLAITLQKQRGMRPDAGDAAARQALDELIDEQIVAQKAIAAKLDQDPTVVAQIEAARRDILARRFLEAAAETASRPGDDAVRKFYDSRPALFAQRKIYTFQRTDIQVPDARRVEVDAHVQALHAPAELADWLKSQKLPFSTQREQQAAEQLPPMLLDKVAAMTDGQSVLVPSQTGVVALTLVSSVSAPKSLADARTAIEQYLANQGRRELVLNLKKTVRDGAKVQYHGRFATPPAAGAGGTTPASAPPASLSTAPAASIPASAASQNSSTQK